MFATRLLFALTTVTALLTAADLTGRWKGELQNPNGGNRPVSFAFKQDGNKLTGFLTGTQGDDAISEGTITGDAFSFIVDTSWGEQKRRAEYHGKVVGEEIQLTMPGFGDRPGRDVTLKRISSEPPVAARSLPKVSLPALRP